MNLLGECQTGDAIGDGDKELCGSELPSEVTGYNILFSLGTRLYLSRGYMVIKL